MKKETARVIVDMMQDISGRLNNSIFLVMEAADEEEVNRYKLAIGRAMGGLLLDIKHPIYEQYPDLTPVELRNPSMPDGFYDPREE
jgi:hypothetical protein